MALVFTLLLTVGLIKLTYRYWERHLADEARRSRRRFLIWLGKGVVAPIVAWIGLNFGVLPGVPALLPHAMLTGGRWISSFSEVAVPVTLVTVSYWAATTFGWVIMAVAIDTEGRHDILGASLFWGLLLLPAVGLVLYMSGLAGMGFAALIWLWPITRDLLALGTPRKIPPLYARALEQMKSGQFTEAERAVIRELEKKEDDYEGWMLLAELYATRFNDLAQADSTVHELCNQPETTRRQAVEALHRLADWHLRLGRDPAAARRVLEEIPRKFPNTHFAHLAQERANQLPPVA